MLDNRWIDMDEKVAARTKDEMDAEILGNLKTLCDSLRLYKGDDEAFTIARVKEIVENAID